MRALFVLLLASLSILTGLLGGERLRGLASIYRKDDIAITPLAIPMLAGPAAISTVILLETQATTFMLHVVLLGCLVLIGLASYIILAIGARSAKWLNPIAEKIISRLMGLLLAALAVQFMVNALTGDQGLLRGLTGH